MPEEKKKEIVNNINTIVDQNKPFIDAIKDFLNNLMKKSNYWGLSR